MTLPASFAWWEIPVGVGGGALLVWAVNRWLRDKYGIDLVDELAARLDRWLERNQR